MATATDEEVSLAIPLPMQEAVRDMFGELFARGIAVDKSGDPLNLDPEIPGLLVEYVTEEGDVAGVILADIKLACLAGAALVMMPAVVAEESIEAGEIDGDMFDCFKEVANVFARLLNSADTPHVKLGRTYRVGDLLPGQLRALLGGTNARNRTYMVSIEEYGEGKMAIATRAS